MALADRASGFAPAVGQRQPATAPLLPLLLPRVVSPSLCVLVENHLVGLCSRFIEPGVTNTGPPWIRVAPSQQDPAIVQKRCSRKVESIQLSSAYEKE